MWSSTAPEQECLAALTDERAVLAARGSDILPDEDATAVALLAGNLPQQILDSHRFLNVMEEFLG